MSAPTLQFRIAEIDARRPSPGAIIECLRFDGDTKQGKTASIIAVAEIHATVYVYERLLDTVHAAINQARTLVAKMEGDPMIRFEKIIQKVNEALAAFAASEATPIHWHRVNLFIFQLAEEHLCFSGVGTLTNAFLQHQEGGSTKAFDLLGSLEQPETPDPRKPLASIVCGNMGIGDVLLVGTQNLQEVREKIGLIPLCQTHPPVTAALEIQQQLQGLRTLESYFGVVIAGVALASLKTEKTIRNAPLIEAALDEPPIHAIHAAEQETEQILEQTGGGASIRLGALVETVRKSLGSAWGGLIKSRPPKERSSLSPISLAGLRGMNAGYARGLLAEKRSAIVISCVAIALLAGGGLWFRSVRRQQAEQRLWTAVYDQAVSAKNRAEAALVYNDEDRARAQYTQALNNLQQLDQKTPDRSQARSALQKELDDIRNRLRKEHGLASPTVVANLQKDGETVTAYGLVIQNGKAFTIDQANNRLLVVDTQNGSISTFNAPDGVTLRLLGNGREAPLVIGNELNVFTVRNNTLTPLNAGFHHASAITALTTYGQRAYILDASQGKIWRYNLSAAGLTGENSYLHEPLDSARRATSMAIDSSIYTGEQDGHITKYTSGQPEGWNASNIDPALKRIDSLWTSADAPVLAIADASGKRVIIFNKAGKLIQQITSPAFKGPTAVWGDAASNMLYILDGTQLIKTELPRE